MKDTSINKDDYTRCSDIISTIKSMLFEYQKCTGKSADALFLGHDIQDLLAASYNVIYHNQTQQRIAEVFGIRVYTTDIGIIGVGMATKIN